MPKNACGKKKPATCYIYTSCISHTQGKRIWKVDFGLVCAVGGCLGSNDHACWVMMGPHQGRQSTLFVEIRHESITRMRMTRLLGKSKPHAVPITGDNSWPWNWSGFRWLRGYMRVPPANVSHHRAGVSSVMARFGHLRPNRSRRSNVRRWQHGKTLALDNCVDYFKFLRENRL